MEKENSVIDLPLVFNRLFLGRGKTSFVFQPVAVGSAVLMLRHDVCCGKPLKSSCFLENLCILIKEKLKLHF